MRRTPLRRKTRIKRLGRWGKEARAAKKWADAVKRRDRMCQFPGCMRYAEEAHHCMPKGRYPELRYERANGLGLCRDHHTGPDGWHSATRLHIRWWKQTWPHRWKKIQILLDAAKSRAYVAHTSAIGAD